MNAYHEQLWKIWREISRGRQTTTLLEFVKLVNAVKHAQLVRMDGD
jgi:hypothetical protein